MDIHRSSLKDFILPREKSVYVIDYYEGIIRMLLARTDYQYGDFLARPRLRTDVEVVWSSDVFSHPPTKFTDLAESDKLFYSSLLHSRLRSMDELIKSLQRENEDLEMLSMLRKVMSHIDEASVYCGEGKVVLVNWGMIPRFETVGEGVICRGGHLTSEWGHRTDSSELGQSAFVGQDNTIGNQEKEQSLSTDFASKQSIEDYKPDVVVVAEEKKCPSGEIVTEVPKLKVEEPREEIANGDSNGCLQQDKSDSAEKKSEEQGVNNNHDRKKDMPKPFDFLKKGLGVLLCVGMLYLLLMFLVRNNQGPIHLINPFYHALPGKPYIKPIENTKIGDSENGYSQVATDRLNVLFDNIDEAGLLKWATEFKRLYPSNGYFVTYFNASIGLLQIVVPSSERMSVKEELPYKMPDFVFEMFEESVSGRETVKFDDPDLGDPSKDWYFNVLDVYDAWDITTGSEEVIVAIVDNGFDLNHPELKGKVYKPYNAYAHNSNVRPVMSAYPTKTAHGTHVAATAVGNANNGQGVAGIAPNCKLMPIQVGYDNPESLMPSAAVIDGVMYAIQNGADVINLSLGKSFKQSVEELPLSVQYNMINNSDKQEEIVWSRICDKAKESNVIIVFAAGNENILAGMDAQKRNSYFIKVSATDEMKNKAVFSNYGYSVNRQMCYSTVSAPGCNIYSAAPGGTFLSMQGTSMSAPIVTGTVALMRSLNNKINAYEVMNVLQKTGEMVDSSIGPLINIRQALLAISSNSRKTSEKPKPSVDCDAVRSRIMALQSQIDSLMQLCPKAAGKPDTLRYRDVMKDSMSLNGVWQSTTDLVSESDNTHIDLFMSFKDMSGTLTLKNQGKSYTASLKAKVSDGRLFIYQEAPASSTEDDSSFSAYNYNCTQDIKGYLLCKATLQDSPSSFFTFNLVKVE